VKLEQSFEVDAPLQAVWEALINVERVAPCLPGAEITGQDDTGAYMGTFSAKVGPASVAYKGTLKMDQVDESTHTATMLANGSDRRGQGGAKATIISKLVEREGGGTKVDIDTDYSITGRLARLGRGGMIQDVGNRLLRDFATCLEQRLLAEGAVEQPATGAEPAAGLAPEAAATPEAALAPEAELATPAPATTATQEPAGTAAATTPPPAAPPRAVPPPPPAAKPISGISLILGVLWDRLRKLAGRG
jgi:carbon monoxide dehydrogenase subunit G